MASTTIDNLQIEIQASSTNAASGLDALRATLEKLKVATKGGAGLNALAKRFQTLAQAVNAMQVNSQKVADLVAALKPLETLGKSNLGSFLNQLRRVPEITNELDAAKVAEFADKIRQVTVAVRPLATEMEKVSRGFSSLPANLQRAIRANAKLTNSNKSLNRSYGILGTGISAFTAKLSVTYLATRKIARIIGGWIKESNDYVESLNLFTVAMGEYATEAKEYAEHVGNLLGIDPAEWMRNQGVFMTLATGFGVAADKAALMSKNLTQLAYDLSSFYNISVQDAMQKVQSGFSGELEPMRRLGYDLSMARLEAIRTALGIEKAVAEMTQAEKSMLRYYAMMTQVTTAQGDMARTINAPANQLRILQSQVTQAARALGNIFIPALNAVLPYAIAFLKVLRKVANEIANFFGFSLPEIDYSGVVVGGEEAAEVIGDADDAVKSFKKTLMGFDELNVLGDALEGVAKVGDGFSFKLPEYDFLGDVVQNRADELAEKLEKPFRDVLLIATEIGVVILGWKIGNNISNFIASMGEISKTKQIQIGVTLMLTGFTLEASGFKSIGEGNATALDYIKAAIGAALGVGGALLTFGTGPAGWIIGIGAALTVAITSFALGQQNKNEKEFANSELGKLFAEVQKEIEKSAQVRAKVGVTIETHLVKLENIDNTWETVRNLVEDVYTLSDITPPTAGDIAEIKAKIQMIDELSLGQIKLEYNELTGEIKNSKEEVIKLIDKLHEQARTVALQDMLVEAYKLQAEEMVKQTALHNKINELRNEESKLVWDKLHLEQQRKDIANELVASYGRTRSLNGELVEKIMETDKKLRDVNYNLNNVRDKIKEAKQEYENSNKALADTNTHIENIKETMSGLIEKADEFGSSAGKEQGAAFANGFKDAINAKKPELERVIKEAITPKVGVSLRVTGGGTDIGYVLQPYATGGFPLTGELFLARESGPEMVGTIGGRTAVANNDQIVEGIRAGVYDAVVAAMSQGDSGQSQSLNIYIDGKQVEAAVRKTQREKGVGILKGGVVFA